MDYYFIQDTIIYSYLLFILFFKLSQIWLVGVPSSCVLLTGPHEPLSTFLPLAQMSQAEPVLFLPQI